VEEVDIPSCKTDHSAIMLQLKSITGTKKGRGHWKLNNTFLDEERYVKGIIENKISWLAEFEEVTDGRLKWELMKYKIREFSMKYGKETAERLKTTEADLESRLKSLETELDQTNDRSKEEEIEKESTELKTQLENIAEYKTKGLILRSQARWHEKGEKSTKYFLQLESRNKIKRSIKKLQKEDGSITTDAGDILKMQAKFYENLYKSKSSKSEQDINNYLSGIDIPNLEEVEKEMCEGRLSLAECATSLKSFNTGKSPGNDGITVEFYRKCRPLFGQLMVDSCNLSYAEGELTTSQRQAVITLLDKGKDRTLLKNWRPISLLLNVDYKIASKAIANPLSTYLQNVINTNQVGFVKNRNITENIRTIADVMDYLKDNNLPGIMVNVDFEKAYDSIEWNFMLHVRYLKNLTLDHHLFGGSKLSTQI
jgi:hypothetical protein